MKERLKFYEDELKKILSRERFEHSLRVVETAQNLAIGFNVDEEKLTLAALIHDRGKELPDGELIRICINNGRALELAEKVDPVLLHGPVGAIIIKEEWNIYDKEILRAVEYHTTACPHMSMIEKIVYLADCLEPARDFIEVEKLRNEASIDIERAFRLALDYTIMNVVKNGRVLHSSTIEARNSVIYFEGSGGRKNESI